MKQFALGVECVFRFKNSCGEIPRVLRNESQKSKRTSNREKLKVNFLTINRYWSCILFTLDLLLHEYWWIDGNAQSSPWIPVPIIELPTDWRKSVLKKKHALRASFFILLINGSDFLLLKILKFYFHEGHDHFFETS